MLSLECHLILTVPNLPTKYVLATFLTYFANADQAALAESSDQGLQCLPIYQINMLCLECLLQLTVPNLPVRYVLAEFLSDFEDAGQAALAESYDQGLQCLPIYQINMLRLEYLLQLTVPNLPVRYVLAEFLSDFADAGQAALAESSDQGLQSLSTFWLYLCYGHLKFIVLYLRY